MEFKIHHCFVLPKKEKKKNLPTKLCHTIDIFKRHILNSEILKCEKQWVSESVRYCNELEFQWGKDSIGSEVWDIVLMIQINMR